MEKVGYKNKSFTLKRIAEIIRNNPLEISSALKHSGVFIENPYDKKELASKVAYNLAHNKSFHKDIGLLLAKYESKKIETFNNLGGTDRGNVSEQVIDSSKTIGSATAAGGKGGNIFGAILGFIVGSVDSAFSIGNDKKQSKINEERYKQELISEIFEEDKTNWIPLYIITGVLIVGGIVTYFALKK